MRMRRHHAGAINLSRVCGVEKVVTADVRFSLRDLSDGRILLPLQPQEKNLKTDLCPGLSGCVGEAVWRRTSAALYRFMVL